MRQPQRIAPWITVVALLAGLGASVTSFGQDLVPRPDGLVGGALVLTDPTAPACCPPGARCRAQLHLENAAKVSAHRVRFVPGALTGGGGTIPAQAITVTPSILNEISPGETRAIAVDLAAPDDLKPGVYRGALTVESASGSATTIPLLVEACAAPSLAIIDGGDVRGGEVRTRPLGPDCHSSQRETRFVVRVEGSHPLQRVTPRIYGLPAGIWIDFAPPHQAIPAGTTAGFRATLELPPDYPQGVHWGTLEVADPNSGARAGVPLLLERCPEHGITDQPPALEAFTLEHSTSRPAVRVGEILTFWCTVVNQGTATLTDLVIEDRLPPGFVYATGRSAIDGQAGTDPETLQPLTWRVGTVPPGSSRKLAFQVTVTSAAAAGENRARAWARTALSDVGPIETVIEVTSKTVESDASVIGRVHRFDGSGVGGIKVMLDYDRELTTQADGAFRFDRVDPGEHAIAVDRRTLPTGAALIGDDAQILRIVPGALVEANFTVAQRPTMRMRLQQIEPRGK